MDIGPAKLIFDSVKMVYLRENTIDST